MLTVNRPYSQATISRTENNTQNQAQTNLRSEVNNKEMSEMAQIVNELKEIIKICNLGKMSR